MQPKEFTIDQVINRQKNDNFGNMTFDIKFLEDERMVYMAAKSEPKRGFKKYGYIEDGQYGPKFKNVKRDDAPYQGGQSSSRPQQPQAGRKSDDERSDDIRWSIAVKEAAAYVTKWQENLEADKWALQINEYANALYKLSEGPDKEPVKDNIVTDEDFTENIDLSKIPF